MSCAVLCLVRTALTNYLQIYFCRFIIEPYLKDAQHSKFIDKAVLDKYWAVGGVRIEGMSWQSSH